MELFLVIWFVLFFYIIAKNIGQFMLESFDEELFCELIDKIIVESNTRIRFRLKNGLELPETIERTVR